MTDNDSNNDVYQEDKSIDKSHRAIIFVGLLFALILILTVVVIITRRKAERPDLIINTIYDVFLANMNTSSHPCIDFYSYVCGSFDENHRFANEWELSEVIDPMIEREHDIAVKLHVALSTGQPIDDRVIELARRIFTDCNDRILGKYS